jgi:hypothetical protein
MRRPRLALLGTAALLVWATVATVVAIRWWPTPPPEPAYQPPPRLLVQVSGQQRNLVAVGGTVSIMGQGCSAYPGQRDTPLLGEVLRDGVDEPIGTFIGGWHDLESETSFFADVRIPRFAGGVEGSDGVQLRSRDVIEFSIGRCEGFRAVVIR